jgi:predicted lipoprotein with Yx(FWY)xxD motif
MTTLRTARLRVAALAAIAISALALAACGSSSSSNSSASSSTAAPAAASSTSSTSATTTAAAAAVSGITIGTAKAHGHTYLTGMSGRSVYLWVADTSDKSNCSGACAQAWPPVTTKGKPTAGAGVNAADLGTTMRSDGTEQVTYNGHPLYYFVADKTAGSTAGQGSSGFGAKWWLVDTSGSAITSSGSSSGGSSGSSSGSSGSSWG